mmetsp:Transcript_11322/g.38596  ORF Transcript_11322/g.38596 Transcript_11322/m.38596 type:complete len:170 (+) Transcript_11322:343-852(+)
MSGPPISSVPPEEVLLLLEGHPGLREVLREHVRAVCAGYRSQRLAEWALVVRLNDNDYTRDAPALRNAPCALARVYLCLAQWELDQDVPDVVPGALDGNRAAYAVCSYGRAWRVMDGVTFALEELDDARQGGALCAVDAAADYTDAYLGYYQDGGPARAVVRRVACQGP